MRPLEATGLLLGVICGFYLPLAWAGFGILARKLWALWVGAGVMLLELSCTLAWFFHYEAFDFGGIYPDPAGKIPLLYLILTYESLQVLAFAIALRAYYSNRNVMRWSRNPASSPGAVRDQHPEEDRV